MKQVNHYAKWFDSEDEIMTEILLLKLEDNNVMLKLMNINLEKAVYCDRYDYYTTTVTSPNQWIGRNELVNIWQNIKNNLPPC